MADEATFWKNKFYNLIEDKQGQTIGMCINNAFNIVANSQYARKWDSYDKMLDDAFMLARKIHERTLVLQKELVTKPAPDVVAYQKAVGV